MVLRLHRTIAERSREQHGLITRQQILELGLSDDQLWNAVRNGTLERLEPTVYRIAGVPFSWEQALTAGLLGLGGSSLVSHLAGAGIWRFDGIRPGEVDFLVERGHRNRLSVGRVHSTLWLPPEHRAEHRGFRVTSPARTIVDCAPKLTRRLLEGVVDGACRDRLTTEAELLECHHLLRRPGRSMLPAVLGADVEHGRPHGWLERELLRVLRAAGLPLPRMQVALSPEGRVVRVDGIYEAQKLIIEVSGHRTHSTRRDRQDDAERKLALELDGHQVAEFTYEDVVQRPAYVVHRVQQLLGWTGRRRPGAA